MRSIRRSLIVYFILLFTIALAAVSSYSYHTTAQSLFERQANARMMIGTQFETRHRALRAELDRRILRQAQTMANLSRSTLAHTDGLAPFGAIGAAALPQGYFQIPVWMAQGPYSPWMSKGAYSELAREIFLAQPIRTHIESADDLIPPAEGEQAQEYFQIYRHNGYPMQRSKSMEDHWFTLDEDLRTNSVLLKETFDEVDIKPGVRVRRVTLKTTVPRLSFVHVAWPWRASFGPPTKMGTKGTPPVKWTPRPGGFESVAPVVFIQYASEIGPTEAKIHALENKRNQQLVELETTIHADLEQLRTNMLWIALATLTAVGLGCYLVIRLGLAPLSRMSRAVSQISAPQFQLPLDPHKLPHELRPIASTLVQTLEQLRKAFDREKQAAADISHELRTPLAALMTTLEVGLRKPRDPEDYRQILEECHASGQHMYELVQRLLALARLDAGADLCRPGPVDAVELALHCADVIRPLAKARGLDLQLHLPDPVLLQTDPNKLREVITNLLHNAVEYNKPNGSIDLTVETINDRVQIEVRDTGIGISSEAIAHIFERFYRADPSRHADTPHAGLGLAIVKSYIDLMGGTIRVASSPAGTVFTIELPVGTIASVETGIRGEPILMGR